MAKPEDLLAAGAFLSVKEKLLNDSIVDSVSARVYRHPALGNRPVVRLTADNLAAGDDLTMEFLGFAAPEVIGPVAQRQRQALGFPGWALVNDPKHARYALELVKEFKKAVRKSKAKPGHGYDEFVEISKRLGKSVAHFLPSFWEQVGREFIAVDNATYASRAFGKAREAEKVHALKVDEGARQDAFLEFALAGAVSIKALTEYGKELSSTHDPKSAWKFFREICVRRTLGGMPPWTSMIKDIQPLMKAAKLDQEEEIHSILAEIIDSPAISRSSMGFWEGASKFVGTLVKKDPHVAGVLLNLIPQSTAWNENVLWPWLDNLETWGILANGWKDDVDEAARPNGGPAAWFSRLIQNGQRLHQKIFDIAESIAARLKRDGVPVNPYQKHRWYGGINCDVDLVDFLLEQKIPFVDPPENLNISLRDWAVLDGSDKAAKNRPRDPVSLVADKRFSQAVKISINQFSGDGAFEVTATGKKALREARQEWLNSLVNGLTTGALPALELSLETIEAKTSFVIFEEFPDAFERLNAAELLPSVTRSLQHGIMDEYGWPALEKIIEDFAKEGNTSPLLYGPFPYLVVTDKSRAIVLKGNEIVHEAELKIPAGHTFKRLLYVDGDLIVWSDVNYQTVCFWNSDPRPGDPEYSYMSGDLLGLALDAPGGGTFVGEKIIHRGDKVSSDLRPTDGLISDGTHWWVRTSEWNSKTLDHVHSIHEVDPVTAKKGRQSLPSFFENYIQDDWKLETESLTLLPLGTMFPNSPLGSKDGLIGYRMRRRPSTWQVEGIDGRSFETSDSKHFTGLLNQAATDKFLPILPSHAIQLWDPSGSYAVASITFEVGGYNRRQAAGLPWHYLHAFEIRDPAASKRLRAISNDDVSLLLEAEQQDHDNFHNHKPEKSTASTATDSLCSEAKHFPLLDAAIQKLLGDKSAPRLRIGVKGIVIRAGQQMRCHRRLVEKRTSKSSKGTSTAVMKSADAAALEQFASFIGTSCGSLPNYSFAESMSNTIEFFEGKRVLTHFPLAWFNFLQSLIEGTPLKIWSALWKDPSVKNWIPFAETWCNSPFHQLRGTFRTFVGETTKADFLATEIASVNAEKPPERSAHVYGFHQGWPTPYVGKSSRFLITRDYRGHNVLEYSPNGQFEGIPDLVEVAGSSITYPSSFWSVERFRRFVELAKTVPLNMPPLDLLKTLAQQVNASVAEVAIVWFGLPNFADYSDSFMPTHLREAYKLKVRECAAARESLRSMAQENRNSLVRSVLDGEPDDLWENPPLKVAERIRVAWGQQSQRLPVSAEWLDRLTDCFDYNVKTQALLPALNSPLTCPLFSAKAKWSFGTNAQDRCEIVCDTDESATFTVSTFSAACISITMLSYGLPVGDPARSKMPDVFKAMQMALANPDLMFSAGTRYDYDPNNPHPARTLIEAAIGKVNEKCIADDGTIAAVNEGYTTALAIRPAKIQTETQFQKAHNQMVSLNSNLGGDSGLQNLYPIQLIQKLRLVRSADFAALVDRINDTPVPAGSYEANPALSAPEVVDQVARKHKLSNESAAYYLQLLALPDPTDKNVMQWNDWKSAGLKSYGKQLVEKGVVLEATRSRAGRKLFLPGAWEDLKAPHLPIEMWKMPLFQMTRDFYQRAIPPLERILPLEPVHQLFAKAWKRIADGDLPKYEEVK